MEWPSEVLVVEHATSFFQELKRRKKQSPLYGQFLAALKANPQSEETRRLALAVQEAFALNKPNPEIPLTTRAQEEEAEPTGRFLGNAFGIPDVVFVSPFVRCTLTWEGLQRGCPALEEAHTIVDDRIREQAHGIADRYYDVHLFFFFHPEEKVRRRREKLYGYRYPGGGENMDDVRVRLREWIETLRREYAEKRVWAITHWRVILALRMEWEGLDEHEFHKIESDTNLKPIMCGVSRYAGGLNGMKLDFYNRRFY